MKRLLFIFVLLCSQAWATTYYVSNCVGTDSGTVGDDGNNGTATGTPWLTISKVNAATFAAGDSILFHKGCTWREQLTVPLSGSSGSVVTIGAYGTGDVPIINGSDVVTSWTQSYVQETGGVFATGAENNAVTDWTGITAAGANTYTATTASKANGTYGYEAAFDGSSINNFAYKTWGGSGEIWVRFYLKLSSNFALNGNYQYNNIFTLREGATNLGYIALQANGSTTSFKIIGQDPNGWMNSNTAISRGVQHYVEIHYKKRPIGGWHLLVPRWDVAVRWNL